MKRTITLIIIMVFVFAMTVTSAHAGASKRRRHHLEGFLLGSGVGFISATIVNRLHKGQKKAYIPEQKQKETRQGRYCREHGQWSDCHNCPDCDDYMEPDGYWTVKRVWVPAEYEDKWNPGHYNKRGKWVSGRYQRFIIRKGHYRKQRIWVSCY